MSEMRREKVYLSFFMGKKRKFTEAAAEPSDSSAVLVNGVEWPQRKKKRVHFETETEQKTTENCKKEEFLSPFEEGDLECRELWLITVEQLAAVKVPKKLRRALRDDCVLDNRKAKLFSSEIKSAGAEKLNCRWTWWASKNPSRCFLLHSKDHTIVRPFDGFLELTADVDDAEQASTSSSTVKKEPEEGDCTVAASSTFVRPTNIRRSIQSAPKGVELRQRFLPFGCPSLRRKRNKRKGSLAAVVEQNQSPRGHKHKKKHKKHLYDL